jgi:hypothetical protein
MPSFVPHLIAILMVAAGSVLVVIATKRYVDQSIAAPVGPLSIVLVNKPAWMSDFLAQQISATVPRANGSTFDRDLLVEATQALQANPWVRDVHQVRRVYGQRPGDTLEVDCEFRAPIALVQWGEYYWLVDGDGVKLPEQFTANHVPRIVMGRDGRLNIRIIEGVRQPPAATGEKAQLVLGTKYGTEIRWGLPLDAKDFFAEVPVAQKLDDLNSVKQQYGRVDAGQPWIDIRYDKVTYPSPAPAADATAHADSGR